MYVVIKMKNTLILCENLYSTYVHSILFLLQNCEPVIRRNFALICLFKTFVQWWTIDSSFAIPIHFIVMQYFCKISARRLYNQYK